MARTPTPWHMMTPSMGFSELRGADGECVFGIAYARKDERREEECEANAAFIVRAVNAHDDLVAALVCLVQKHIKLGPFDEPLGNSEQTPEVVGAIAALDKAGAAS